MNKEDRIESLRKMEIVDDFQIQMLKEMGFFTAPASTKYHGDYEGGLFDHSLEVAKYLYHLTDKLWLNWNRGESPWIVGMFHDLCKCDAYIKNDIGFTHNDKCVLTGHGEKSVMALSQIMTLTGEEILCIRYHMGAYNTDEWKQYDLAIRKYPNVLFTHTADMYASKVVGV